MHIKKKKKRKYLQQIYKFIINNIKIKKKII